MIHYLPNNAETENQLRATLRIIRDPENWCKGKMQQGKAFFINGALYAAKIPNTPIPEDQFSSDPLYTRDNIKRGELQESFWFLRQALMLCSDHGNRVKFNDDPATEHHQVMVLICLAIKLVQADDLGIYYEIEDAAQVSLPSVVFIWHWNSRRNDRVKKRPKVELVPVEADSDTQRVLERLIKALEKHGIIN